jgi:hypothetical protein
VLTLLAGPVLGFLLAQQVVTTSAPAVVEVASVVGVTLAAIVLIFAVYFKWLYRSAKLGAVCLGLAWAITPLPGAGIAGWAGLTGWPLLLSALVLGAYVTVVRLIAAAGNDRNHKFVLLNWTPTAIAVPVLAALVVFRFAHQDSAGIAPWISLYPLAWMSVRTAWLGSVLRGRPDSARVQQAVEQLLRGIMLLQAALMLGLCPGHPPWLIALAIMFIIFPAGPMLNRLLRR